MLKINGTLLTALFVSPNPQPERSEVGVFYKKLQNRIFPTPHLFSEYLMAQSIDKQYELATKIIQSLSFFANFPPPYYALYDVLSTEKYQNNMTSEKDSYIPRDHFLHIVNLYILGIYVFFYNSEFYSRIVYDNLFARKKSHSENSTIDCIKDFISEWKYFCLFHDVGYTAELLGNKNFNKNDQRETILEGMQQNGCFHASFSPGKPLCQITYLGTVEILSKLIFSQFILDDSKDRLNKNHRIFRDVKNETLKCYCANINSSQDVHFSSLSPLLEDAGRLEKIYSNHCLKVLLPILGRTNIVSIGFEKKSKRIVFISYCENGIRKLAILPYFESSPELATLIADPNLLLFDDYVSDYEIEYFYKPSSGSTSVFYDKDNLKRSSVTVFRTFSKKYLSISTEQQFLDFQYDLFAWINKEIDPNGISGPLKEHLDTWRHGLDDYSPAAVKFYSDNTQIIIRAVKENRLRGINKMCSEFLMNEIDNRKVRTGPNHPKTVYEAIGISVTSFCTTLKELLASQKTEEALITTVESKQLELFEDDKTLLELFSQIYVKLYHTLDKTEKVFSYDYEKCKASDAPFLSRCINSRLKKYYNDKTVSSIKKSYKLQHGITSDHGIFSAQYASSIFELYRNALDKANDSVEIALLSILFNICGDYGSDKERYIANYDHIFEKTLYAIFVHNLYPCNFRDSQLAEVKATLTEPFSYLALICDALQQWNRPHSLFPAALERRPNEDASEDYDISISQNHILIREKKAERYKKAIMKSIDDMAKYISGADAFISLE